MKTAALSAPGAVGVPRVPPPGATRPFPPLIVSASANAASSFATTAPVLSTTATSDASTESSRPSTAVLFQTVPVVPLPSSSTSVLYHVRSSGFAIVPLVLRLDARPEQLLDPGRGLQRARDGGQVADEEALDRVDLVLRSEE